jgi:hydrogenase maturation protease
VNPELAKKVADAVLYEGYMLYPYRPSAIKNRQRWTCGILYPPAYGEVQRGTERAEMRSECLVTASGDARVHIQLRCLHLLARQVARAVEDRFEPVSSLVVDGQLVETWDEGVERSVEFDVALQDRLTRRFEFSFPGFSEAEELRESGGQIVGKITRTQHELHGRMTIASQRVRESVWKLLINVSNSTELPVETVDRDQALLQSLLSAHTSLTVSGGEFVSLLDPPDDLRDLVSECKNVGNFPVLVGNEGECDMMLCSPIVLYDYPQIAPESAGDFYDATEMDEMLTLRVMTLTDDEKTEMGRADAHARNLLERTEESAREQLARTHGAIRSMRPVSEKR